MIPSYDENFLFDILKICSANNYSQFSILKCSGFVTTDKIENLPYITIGKLNFVIQQYKNQHMLSSLINILRKKMNKYCLFYLESY